MNRREFGKLCAIVSIFPSLPTKHDIPSISVKKFSAYMFATHGIWEGTVYLERDDGHGYKVHREDTSRRDRNISLSGFEYDAKALYRVRTNLAPNSTFCAIFECNGKRQRYKG